MSKIICAVLLALALSSAQLALVTADSHISIHIVKPGDRRNIPTGDSLVAVEILGAENSEGYYWELYGDQLLIATVRDGSASATINFRRTGPHQIQVVLFDAQAKRVASHEILVIAAPVEYRTDPFNRQQFAPAMAILVLTISALIGFSVWFSRRSRKKHFENEQTPQSPDVQTKAAHFESV